MILFSLFTIYLPCFLHSNKYYLLILLNYFFHLFFLSFIKVHLSGLIFNCVAPLWLTSSITYLYPLVYVRLNIFLFDIFLSSLGLPDFVELVYLLIMYFAILCRYTSGLSTSTASSRRTWPRRTARSPSSRTAAMPSPARRACVSRLRSGNLSLVIIMKKNANKVLRQF